MDPLLYKDGVRIFKSLDKSKCGFLPTLRENHISKSPGKMNVDTCIHICKSQGKMNVDTFLYREESTWIKVRFGGEMVWYRNGLLTETSCLILVEEKLYY